MLRYQLFRRKYNADAIKDKKINAFLLTNYNIIPIQVLKTRHMDVQGRTFDNDNDTRRYKIMVGVNGLGNMLNRYGTTVQKTQKKEKTSDTKETTKAVEKKVSDSEGKLSAKAQEYLKKLREKYKDYDFIIANEGDDSEGLAAASTKEYSVMISSDEIEKMANDEEYSNKVLTDMESAIDMSKKVSEEYGYIKKMTIELLGDGNINFLAELVGGKKLEATSEENLRSKLNEIDWDKIAAEAGNSGTKIDFSV